MALQRTRLLGRGGPEVSAIGFGTMGLSMTYGDVGSDEQRLQVLDHVHKLGCRFWDTADVYGDSEDLIGKWFQRSGKRNDIFVATKFGGTVNTAGEYVVRSDPEYVRQACLESLRRLGISQIDLYYCHRVDLKTPIEKTVQAMAKLKALVTLFLKYFARLITYTNIANRK
jgi:aryl-alcohol dehydrogenase-like predicted oxidoreductase